MDVPIRLIGDEHNPTNVVIEMNGTVIWRARGGFFEGILFRRQKLAANGDEGELLRVEDNARLGMIQCSFDNGGGAGPVVSVEGPREMGEWTDVSIFGGGDGIRLSGQAKLDLKQVRFQQISFLFSFFAGLHPQECRKWRGLFRKVKGET